MTAPIPARTPSRQSLLSDPKSSRKWANPRPAAVDATNLPVPGKTPAPYAGRVFDEDEVVSLVDASLDFWLTSGDSVCRQLEKGLATFVGVTECRLVNSGSSANLLAFSTLTFPRLGDRRLRPGDEMITVAAGFPTTVAPAIQRAVVPVFVDVDPVTDNIDTSMLTEALSSRTKAVMVAHTPRQPL